MYKLILMSFDGEYVTEKPEFETVQDAWEYENDLGSKWFFFPFPFVVTETKLTIVDSPEMLDVFNGKRVKTIQNLFKDLCVEENEGLDPFEFGFLATGTFEKRWEKWEGLPLIKMI